MADKGKKPEKKSTKIIKRVLAILGCILGTVLLVVVVYVIYVFAAYHRVGSMPLEADNRASGGVSAGHEYDIVSYNIGFGAYEDDFGFFMDGGSEGRAWSKDRLTKNLENIAGELKSLDADFYFLQEVDVNSTRSYHVNEVSFFKKELSSYSSLYAENWDSPFLWLPLIRPHGSAETGIMIFAKTALYNSERVELPVETGVMKIIDLDRCYEKTHVSVDNGKELVLYNFHLSAYTSDGKIATEQLKKLISDIEKECEKGNYVIAGGDFNKDLLGTPNDRIWTATGDYTWAQAFPKDLLEGKPVRLVAPFNSETMVPSCRNADGPYNKNQFVLTIDGFLVSDNIDVVEGSADVVDTGFKYSDHNPVRMSFILH